MNKSIIFSLIALLLVPVGAMNAFAVVVFSEDFDSGITGWSPGTGNSVHSPGQAIIDACNGVVSILPSGEAPPVTTTNWGVAGIVYTNPDFVEIHAGCETTFSVTTAGNYAVSAVLGTTDINGVGDIHITSNLLIDGVPVVSAHGEDPASAASNIHPPSATTPPAGPSDIFLSATTHTVGFEVTVVYSPSSATPGAPYFVSAGPWRAHIDDILIESNFPVGSSSIPIESTSLFVASAPASPMWLAPLVLSAVVAGMGLVLVRKN